LSTERKASGSFLKKRTKKLLVPVGCGTAVATARRKSKFFLLLFCSQKRSAFLPFLLFALPAHAQQFPQDATPGKCLPAQHVAPGDAPGGNVFASHFGPQPPDAPNDEVATYPDIQPTTPDPVPDDPFPKDGVSYPPFPFSGGINDSALSQTAETPATPNKGC